MNSVEKVKAAIARAEQASDDPSASTEIKVAGAAIAMFRGTIEGFLPKSPDELDELLARGAGWMLGLRSDDAAPIIVDGDARRQLPIQEADVAPDQPTVDEQMDPEARGEPLDAAWELGAEPEEDLSKIPGGERQELDEQPPAPDA